MIRGVCGKTGQGGAPLTTKPDPLLLPRQIYCVSSLINLSNSILKLLLLPDAFSYFHTKAPLVVGYLTQLTSLFIFSFPVAELNKSHFFQIKMFSYFCSHAYRSE